MQLDPKAFEAAMKSVEGLPVYGLSYERRVITAYLSALPSPEPTEAEVEAALEALDPSYSAAARESAPIGYQEALSRMRRALIAASRSRPAAAKAGMVKLDANEIWEFLFGRMEGAVPEELSDEVLADLATHINTHFLAALLRALIAKDPNNG